MSSSIIDVIVRAGAAWSGVGTLAVALGDEKCKGGGGVGTLAVALGDEKYQGEALLAHDIGYAIEQQRGSHRAMVALLWTAARGVALF